MRGTAVLLSSLLAFGLAANACATDFTSCEGEPGCGGATGGDSGTAGAATAGTAGTMGDGGDNGAGGDASGGAGGSAAACDDTKSPLEEPCRARDDVAVFAAPHGDNLAAGTRAAPVASISEAIERATAEGKVVIACSGSYDENIVVRRATTDIQIFGGFACDDAWLPPQPNAPLSVVAPRAGVPLVVDQTTTAVRISGVEFRAAAAVGAGESSIAVVVSRSSDVELTRMKLVAGRGADGANGATVTHDFPTAAELRGNNANGINGGLPRVVLCPGGSATTTGGAGGGGSAVSAAPTAGQDGGPSDLGGGKGGALALTCSSGEGGGGDGASAPEPKLGAGAATLGLPRPTGWLPAAGEPGRDGRPGQGGGGGRGGIASGGGGGGAGGCGGRGGEGGQGGGGSIALYVYESTVRLSDAELVTGGGGTGGDGAVGQLGQQGGLGGDPHDAQACGGGAGGQGAEGGAGGGGAGGVSVGVLFTGGEPELVRVGFTMAGLAGQRGSGGAGAANAGIAGVRERLLEL